MFRVSATVAMAFTFAYAVPSLAAVDQKMSAFVLCKNEKNVRSIRILPSEKDNNCTITYSKGTSEEVVGADRSMSNCKSILKNIQANLESSKWTCKSYQKAAITTSSEIVTQ